MEPNKKKKKEKGKLKVQAIYLWHSISPLSFFSCPVFVRQHLTVAYATGTQGAKITAWGPANSGQWESRAEVWGDAGDPVFHWNQELQAAMQAVN